MTELFLLPLGSLSTWLIVLAVACCILPLLIARAIGKADHTEERRESERGEL